MHSQLADAHGSGPADQSAEMIHMAVDAAIGAESQQMKGAVAIDHPVCQLLQRRGGAELIIANGVADPHQLLADDPTGTDGQVPHL